MGKVEKYTKYAEDIANDDSHGYSQINRWGNPDFDCSGLVITAVEKSGIPVKTKGASYTGNMYSVFINCGFKDVTGKINTSNGGGLMRGDILLTPGHHTAIYSGNGKVTEASCNEFGGATGGKSGDQTGKEIWTHSYYNYPWQKILRYPEETPKHEIEYKATEKPKFEDGKYVAKYRVLEDCPLRHGAGKTKAKLVKLPKNTTVTCNGQYSKSALGNIFLYVETKVDGVKYTGFCYINHLERKHL